MYCIAVCFLVALLILALLKIKKLLSRIVQLQKERNFYRAFSEQTEHKLTIEINLLNKRLLSVTEQLAALLKSRNEPVEAKETF